MDSANESMDVLVNKRNVGYTIIEFEINSVQRNTKL